MNLSSPDISMISQSNTSLSMMGNSVIHRYLDPGESLAEVLFGLVMVLTFTLGVRLLTAGSDLDGRELIVAAVGCNIAWGIIDAVLFVLGRLFHRSHRAQFLRALKSAGSEEAALAIVRNEFGLEEEPLAIPPEDRARLYKSILMATSHTPSVRAGLQRRDFPAAVIVFFLVSATALPAIIPFLLLNNTYLALRLSNLLLLLLLFVVGYWWAHFTDANPLRIALTVTLLGLSMVLVAVALGG